MPCNGDVFLRTPWGRTMKSRILQSLLASAALVPSVLIHTQVAQGATVSRPNVILILLDDARLDDIGAAMAHVVSRIEDAGATFGHFYASFPYCCPARATLLTGEYPHNHGVL